MPQSLVTNLMHLVYSTKYRVPCIREDLRAQLYAYQAGIFAEWESPALAIGGVADHVHALFSLTKNRPLAKLVEEVKKGSSKWMKTNRISDFYWQTGYAAFSVSESNVEVVRKYIVNQEKHHQRLSFQDELRLLLEKHKLKFDERYVWD